MHYECPLDPCQQRFVLRGDPQDLHSNGTLALRLSGEPLEGDHPNQHPETADKLMGLEADLLVHLEGDHYGAHDWLIAYAAMEQQYEAAAATQNQENDRAWAAVRSAQQGLQEARDELRDLQLALSERQGAEARQTAAQSCSCTTMTTPEEETP